MTVTIGPKGLPKRARDAIARAEAETERWKAKALAATSESTEGTNVHLSGQGVEPDRGLPPNAVVEFQVGDHRFRAQIEDTFCGLSLSISTPDGLLAVYPSSSNVVRIQGRGRG